MYVYLVDLKTRKVQHEMNPSIEGDDIDYGTTMSRLGISPDGRLASLQIEGDNPEYARFITFLKIDFPDRDNPTREYRV